MFNIQRNQSLKSYNTLGFDQRAAYFATVQNDDMLGEALEYARKRQLDIFVLGGGSNLVLTQDINALVIHCAQSDIKYEESHTDQACKVTVGAGVKWHSLVLDTLKHGLPGLENLSLIPGQTGAAPVQNIGAYGVEIKDRLVGVRALHIPSGQWQHFTAAECQFEYRNSYFKRRSNEFLISEVTLQLGCCHALDTSYASLSQYLETNDINQPTAMQISQAVIAIRQSRLPDPLHLGNVGSFFHNPVVTREHAMALKAKFPDLMSFYIDQHTEKLSAAWMIDTLGYKGIRRGNIGVFEHQALVLVSYARGQQNGGALMDLAREIQSAVVEQFDVKLSIEPVIV